MGLIFADSFNHYNTITDKWDFPFDSSIQTVPTIARTGTRACQVIGSTGPFKNIGPGQQVVQYLKLIQGVAMNFDGITSNSFVMEFNNCVPGGLNANVIVQLNPDGSLSVFRGAGDTVQTLLGTTAAGIFVFSPGNTQWNYMQVKVFVHHTLGSVEILFTPPNAPTANVLSLTNQNTASVAFRPYTNQVGLLALSGITKNCFFADYYCVDWSTPPPNNGYLGPVRIYATVPFANGSPVQWTPSAGMNWQNVDEIPPDADTTFNSSGTVGQVDQYQYNSLNVPPHGQIAAVQHTMDLKVDLGARQVGSVVNGVLQSGAVYLPSNFYAMTTFDYDLNPSTGNPWAGGDFPANFGPEVTA